MVGIDYRPKTGDLYGVGSNSAVYRINPQTGIAIAENVDAMGNPVPFTPGLNGSNFGIDFNPAPDAVRIVSGYDAWGRPGAKSGHAEGRRRRVHELVVQLHAAACGERPAVRGRLRERHGVCRTRRTTARSRTVGG